MQSFSGGSTELITKEKTQKIKQNKEQNNTSSKKERENKHIRYTWETGIQSSQKVCEAKKKKSILEISPFNTIN